jgi:hypothetical protein
VQAGSSALFANGGKRMNHEAVTGSPARPAPKTWGPFTGRQLTTVICVLAVTIAFPFGAWATISGSNSFITDAVSGSHATVSNGVLTENVAPTHNFVESAIVDAPFEAFAAIVTASSTHADIITQVDFDWQGMTPNSDFLLFTLGKVDLAHPGNGPCGTLSSHEERFDFSNAADTRAVNFNPGYIVPGGTSLCFGFAGTGSQMTGRAYGYFTTSTAVASPFLGRWQTPSAALFRNAKR